MTGNKISPRVVAIHRNHTDEIIGTGVLLDTEHVLTCAHVVCDAYNINKNKHCTVDKAAAINKHVTATCNVFGEEEHEREAIVVDWYPPKQLDKFKPADIALLKLTKPVETALPPLICLGNENLASGLALLVAGFSYDEGDWVHACYVAKTRNWHRLNAQTGEFLGGLSGGPIVERCSATNTDRFAGITVANGGSTKKGQMIALNTLLQVPLIAQLLACQLAEKEKVQPPIVAVKPDQQAHCFPVSFIQKYCLMFFDRTEVIKEVNTHFNKLTFLLLAVQGHPRDGFDKLSRRILLEAKNDCYDDRWLWRINVAQLCGNGGNDCVDTAMFHQAKDHFFGKSYFAEKAEQQRWQNVVKRFCFENLHENSLARLVVEFNLPKKQINKKNAQHLSYLIGQWMALQNHINIQVSIVLAVESTTHASGVFAGIKKRFNWRMGFTGFCQYIANSLQEDDIHDYFKNARLERLTPKNTATWQRCFLEHFHLRDEHTYRELADTVDQRLKEKQAVHYNNLVNFVTKTIPYKSFLRPNNTKNPGANNI